jgi:hypothetical protein
MSISAFLKLDENISFPVGHDLDINNTVLKELDIDGFVFILK